LTFESNEATIESVFKQIESLSEFKFAYNSSKLDVEQKISVKADHETIDVILDKILGSTDFQYRIVDRYIIINDENGKNPTKLGSEQANKTVKGKVTDASGATLPGVSVVVKGTTIGVITDNNGTFSLSSIPENATLQFSFVGMKTQEIAVGGKATINIILTDETVGIEEVVAIGYGTQKKVNLTGAVSAIQGNELQKAPTANLSNSLAGLVPGMTVSQGNGRPGSASSINIRGIGTWNNQDPLYVIDGFVRDKEAFDAIDPNEVETISVLKDAATASIYGSRAANGVILITTKKGKIQAPEITYKGTYTMDSRVKRPDVLNAWEAATLFNDNKRILNTPDNSILYFAPDELQYYLDHPDLYTNWLEQVWNMPVTQQHNLSINGGTEKIRYFMSAGYYDGTGFLESINYKKQNFRVNVESSITKNLTAEIRLDINNRESNQPNWPNDGGQFDMFNIINGLQVRSPVNRAYVNGLPSVLGSNWHPISAIKSGSNKDMNDDFNGVLRLVYAVPFIKGLELDASYNQTRSSQFTKQFYQHHPIYNFQTSGSHNHLIEDGATLLASKIYAINPYEFIQEDYYRQLISQFNTSIRYKNSFGKNDINAVFVYEQTESFNDNFMGRGEDFATHYIEQINAASSDPARRTSSGSGSELGRMSYIGRLNYDYAGKYLLEGSFRYDGSIIFAPQNRWGFFPSLSAGWRISEESFFKNNINFVNNLKLRVSSGLVGNDAVAAYQYMQNYNYSGVMYYGTAYKGIALGTLPNENITWEKSWTNNLGIDAGFLNNSLTLSGDFFYRHTYDILKTRILTIPSTFGATLPDENYAQVDVKGLEVSVGYKNQIGAFRYNITGNLGYAKDKVVKLDVPANSRPYQNPIGLPLNTIWGYKSAGILRTQKDLDNYKAKVSSLLGKTPELGQLAFEDIRGVTGDEPDGIVDANDQQLLSINATPKLNYGLTLDVSWKNFNLSMVWQGLGMWDIMLDSKSRTNTINDNITLYGFYRDHWTPENVDAAMPRVGGALDPSTTATSDFWLQSGAFLRMKDLSLSYSLPHALCEKISAKKISLLFDGTNLLTFTNYEFCDPEQRTLSSYPTMKSITFGLNVTF
jgi:TonB-linked SusC/RagA family outer membrane protein